MSRYKASTYVWLIASIWLPFFQESVHSNTELTQTLPLVGSTVDKETSNAFLTPDYGQGHLYQEGELLEATAS